jgi:hypothetical protein
MKHLAGMCAVALAALAGAPWAFDLTGDRGVIAQEVTGALNINNPYTYKVYNVGSNAWVVTTSCDMTWANTQWRGEDGKRLLSVKSKASIHQHDDLEINNGWFVPDPGATGGCNRLDRGWGDSYGNPFPDLTYSLSHSIKPTLHVRLDPYGHNVGDENLVNNESWITLQWDPNANNHAGQFVPLENLDFPPSGPGSVTLTPHDSLFYGVYSTNQSYGNITITNKTRTNTLVDGDEKMGFQARRMTVVLTGGTKNTYTIKNGSKVTMEFLGQNKYSEF